MNTFQNTISIAQDQAADLLTWIINANDEMDRIEVAKKTGRLDALLDVIEYEFRERGNLDASGLAQQAGFILNVETNPKKGFQHVGASFGSIIGNLAECQNQAS